MLGVTYLAYAYMIKPANLSFAQQKNRVHEKLSRMTHIKNATDEAIGLSDQLDQLKQAVMFFEDRLPPKSQIHKVLEQVTIIAQEQGLKPKMIRTLQKKSSNDYIEQQLKMELAGDFNSFYSFLLELEQLQRIVKVRKLKLIKDKSLNGEISADCIVSVFFQNETS